MVKDEYSEHIATATLNRDETYQAATTDIGYRSPARRVFRPPTRV
jgi:hypothetical protein